VSGAAVNRQSRRSTTATGEIRGGDHFLIGSNDAGGRDHRITIVGVEEFSGIDN
jgi:hypothetical protein